MRRCMALPWPRLPKAAAARALMRGSLSSNMLKRAASARGSPLLPRPDRASSFTFRSPSRQSLGQKGRAVGEFGPAKATHQRKPHFQVRVRKRFAQALHVFAVAPTYEGLHRGASHPGVRVQQKLGQAAASLAGAHAAEPFHTGKPGHGLGRLEPVGEYIPHRGPGNGKQGPQSLLAHLFFLMGNQLGQMRHRSFIGQTAQGMGRLYPHLGLAVFQRPCQHQKRAGAVGGLPANGRLSCAP